MDAFSIVCYILAGLALCGSMFCFGTARGITIEKRRRR